MARVLNRNKLFHRTSFFFSPSWALNRASDVMMRWNAFILKRTGSSGAATHGLQTHAGLTRADRKKLGGKKKKFFLTLQASTSFLFSHFKQDHRISIFKTATKQQKTKNITKQFICLSLCLYVVKIQVQIPANSFTYKKP